VESAAQQFWLRMVIPFLHSETLHSVLTSRKLMVQTSPSQILLKMLVKPWQLV
jgi:hypothetical protein